MCCMLTAVNSLAPSRLLLINNCTRSAPERSAAAAGVVKLFRRLLYALVLGKSRRATKAEFGCNSARPAAPPTGNSGGMQRWPQHACGVWGCCERHAYVPWAAGILMADRQEQMLTGSWV